MFVLVRSSTAKVVQHVFYTPEHVRATINHLQQWCSQSEAPYNPGYCRRSGSKALCNINSSYTEGCTHARYYSSLVALSASHP